MKQPINVACAVAMIPNGATIMVGGFMGVPPKPAQQDGAAG